MVETENKNSVYDMLYLTACSINKEVPSAEKVQKMDLEKLYNICKFHSLTVITADALEKAGVQLPKVWKEASAKAIRKNLLLDVEREQILDFMEKSGIWYMPLKGVILKNLYPKSGMRQMSDNDILYDSNFCKQLCEYMKSRGYTPKGIGVGHHDDYQKPPVYNFEMHRYLFEEIHDANIADYYSDIKRKLVKDENKKYGYHFTDEDFYIFMIVHESKHYSIGGTGLRSLLDCFVYLREKGDKLNWDYINSELTKLGISDYEKKSRELSMKVFASSKLPELSSEEKSELEYYLMSGTYGTTKNHTINKMKDFSEKSGSTSKFRYILKRIFPDLEFYKAYFPFFYKHKWLLPIGWFYRLFRGIFCKRKKIAQEMKVVVKR